MRWHSFWLLGRRISAAPVWGPASAIAPTGPDRLNLDASSGEGAFHETSGQVDLCAVAGAGRRVGGPTLYRRQQDGGAGGLPDLGVSHLQLGPELQYHRLEIHVKDEARFPKDKWAFFVSPDGKAAGSLMPQTASCYSCHQGHGVVDTTFVQFYPTLMPIAKDKGTLTVDYLKEIGAK